MSQSAPVIVVTGASRGIGRGISLLAAEHGFSVAINYLRDSGAAEETVDLCNRNKKDEAQTFLAIPADVSTPDGRSALVDETLSKLSRIDALVNNAGRGPKVRMDITNMTTESYSDVMRVNLDGPLFLTQSVVNYWLSGKVKSLLPGGFKVLFISSVSAYTASIDRGEYCISKAGLSMVSKLWAVRLADAGIQVFEIRPGIIETEMTKGVKGKYDPLISGGVVPQKRWGKPEDVGLAVCSVLSGHFPFSTGEVVNVDGGFHLQRL
ncbi:MAG: 3-ketoacyl-ACP reductase [Bacteroidetes bacterium]|nr:3-ketoacyl-ACP reductase [Bacteroidota bacterium]